MNNVQELYDLFLVHHILTGIPSEMDRKEWQMRTPLPILAQVLQLEPITVTEIIRATKLGGGFTLIASGKTFEVRKAREPILRTVDVNLVYKDHYAR